MKVNLTYPSPARRRAGRLELIRVARWPFLLSAYTCLLINLCKGEPAWSVVVL